jgi:FO synthase
MSSRSCVGYPGGAPGWSLLRPDEAVLSREFLPASTVIVEPVARLRSPDTPAPSAGPENDELLRVRLLDSSLPALMDEAAAVRDARSGALVSYSRKVFIPLTRLCRDVCHYCTFAHPPRKGESAYLTPDEVLAIAEAGAKAGCKEALFTLGDKPERRYSAAREALAALGHATTISYLAAMCDMVFRKTGLLPHANPGVMADDDIAVLRRVSVSQGIMLESASARLCAPGGPHHGSPDKDPAARLASIVEAGRQRVPLTTGILIGIGETRAERLDALFAIRAAHAMHGHIQEVIVQNFRAKPGTRMAGASEPALDELLWTVAAARLILGPGVAVQAPPNLSPGAHEALVAAGICDWGGVSPVTPDHVNPEAPWPEIARLAEATARAGRTLVERLAIYPSYALAAEGWVDARLAPSVRRAIDADGLARGDRWAVGAATPPPPATHHPRPVAPALRDALARAGDGDCLTEGEIAALFRARGSDFDAVVAKANALRRRTVGDVVTYAVNRNINYTNICTYGCRFCAFSKGRVRETLRETPYALDLAEIARRAEEAWTRGATEVCMQGGIHPSYTGETYLSILRAVKDAVPGMHVHAFSPLEVTQGAATLGLAVPDYLARLRDAGLGSLPGTAAEILDDDVRAGLCPDKLSTAEWLGVIEAAHAAGLPTTATIMFGHIDGPESWARHLLHIRAVQERTRGFTEFVPLPFVHMEAPLYLKGRARRGPTWREAVLMHAVSRLALHPVIPNIQVSWVKMGTEGARACLNAGANDLGGTLMNESISRAAGATHGQELDAPAMEALIRAMGRTPRRRDTLYGRVSAERRAAAFTAPPLKAPRYGAAAAE